MRSSVDGWVENNRMRLCPVRGLTMKRCAVAGFACIGRMCEATSSFSRALSSGRGRPARRAPLASAWLVVDSPEIDPLDDGRARRTESGHGLEIPGQNQAALAIGLPVSHLSRCLGHGNEANLDLRGYGHAVQLLLPLR